MPKVTPAQIARLGFVADQFGAPGDWLATDGYLAEIITSVAEFVRNEVGAGLYDSATGPVLSQLVDAEKALTSAELWRRRAAFVDASSSLGNSDSRYRAGREYLTNGDKAEQRGLELMAKVSGTRVYGGLAVGLVATGRFAGSDA